MISSIQQKKVQVLLTLAFTMILFGCSNDGPELTPQATPPTSSEPTPVSEPAPEEITESDGIVYGGVRNQGEEPQYGGIATFSHRRDLPGSDPMYQSSISLHNVIGSVYGRGSLVRSKREDVYTIEGFLADTWKSEQEGKIWTFTLHPNIKWHDGAPLTAEDVAYWLELATNPPEGRSPTRFLSNLQSIEQVEVLDPLTIKVTHSSPNPHWLEALSDPKLVISHPKHLVEKEIQKKNVKIQPSEYGWVAAGPFKMLEYDKGSIVRVRRSDTYFEQGVTGLSLPYMDGIDFGIMRDRSAMVSAFRAGRLDGTSRGVGFHINPEAENKIREEMQEKAWFGRVLYFPWASMFNSVEPPFNDIKLRKAVNLFLDRQEGVQTVHGGNAVVGSIWPPGSPWGNSDVNEWEGFRASTKEQDRNEARSIIKDAGYTNLSVEVLCRNVYITQCEYFDNQLRELGLNPVLNMADIGTIEEKTQSGNYQLQLASMPSLFPSETAANYISTNPHALARHGDPKVDELLDKINTTADAIERAKITKEFERYFSYEQSYGTFWWWEVSVLAYRSHVKGVPIPHQNVQNNTDYATTWLDE